MRSSSPERFRQIDALLDALLDLPTGERDEYVLQLAKEDADLGEELLRRLDAHRSSADFLERSALELAAPLLPQGDTEPAPRAEAAPQRVGPYRIVREIGHGGMGTVYLAERDDGQFEQRVALKLIRHALTHRAGLVNRFLEERRILAVLEHPGIARLVDGGVTDEGVPWFAMEYVDGEPLDRYCDAHSLTLEQRLALFGSVCDAVQYAHQHLVVHRDLKPSNVLVTNEGTVKLLDFGIAKLVDPLAEPGADATRTEWQAMTPEYAAPEQVRRTAVSTETDVYALGVVLYALVAGRRPYELRGRSPAEVEHIVCELEPPKPSAAFAPDAGAGVERNARARVRGESPDRLRRQIQGDLDAIIMQALRKEPSRRYPSAAALLDDLRRLRTRMPVLARPDGARYRLGKFALRHRLGIAVAAALLIVLTGGFTRERVLRARAETESRKSKAVEAYVVGIFDGSDPFSSGSSDGRQISTRALLDRGAQRVGTELAAQPEVEAEMRTVLSRVYTSLGAYDAAEAQAQQALARRSALHGPRDLEVAEATDQLGLVMLKRDSLAVAERLLLGALATRKALLAPDDSAIGESLEHLAELYQNKSEFDKAVASSKAALVVRKRVFGGESSKFASNLVDVALNTWMRGDYDESERLLRQAIAIQRRTIGDNAALTAMSLHNLAQTMQMQGRLDSAEVYYRRALAAKRAALGDAHPTISINLNNLGRMLGGQMDRPAEAEPLIREALAMDRKMFGEKHAFVAASLNNLALVLRLKGDFPEAESIARQSLAINRALYSEENKSVALDLGDVGSIMLLRGNFDSAVVYLRGARDRFARMSGPGHINTLVNTSNLARALRERGDLREAEELLRDALTRIDSSNTGQRAIYIAVRVGLGRTLEKKGRHAEALELLEPMPAMALQEWKPGSWRQSDSRLALAAVLESMGRFDDARPLIESSRAVLAPMRRAQPLLAAESDRLLARLPRAARTAGASRA
ncbi:MAG TPA: serine/threonine-protein kinase [Gemmatimonadaceae bacterium]|nr:serine/threonine-protein kinase [Gemmatimonadaceae bacterium]